MGKINRKTPRIYSPKLKKYVDVNTFMMFPLWPHRPEHSIAMASVTMVLGYCCSHINIWLGVLKLCGGTSS